MLNLIKSILIVSAVATSYVAVPSIGAAQDVELRIGPGGGGVYDRDRYGGRRARGCDPDIALDKARDRGIRRGRITNMSSNSVAVDGMSRRGPMRAEFYNRRGCPIIRTFYLN